MNTTISDGSNLEGLRYITINTTTVVLEVTGSAERNGSCYRCGLLLNSGDVFSKPGCLNVIGKCIVDQTMYVKYTIYVDMYVCIMCLYVCMHACLYMCMYVLMCVCTVCMNVCMCEQYVHVCTYCLYVGVF